MGGQLLARFLVMQRAWVNSSFRWCRPECSWWVLLSWHFVGHEQALSTRSSWSHHGTVLQKSYSFPSVLQFSVQMSPGLSMGEKQTTYMPGCLSLGAWSAGSCLGSTWELWGSWVYAQPLTKEVGMSHYMGSGFGCTFPHVGVPAQWAPCQAMWRAPQGTGRGTSAIYKPMGPDVNVSSPDAGILPLNVPSNLDLSPSNKTK